MHPTVSAIRSLTAIFFQRLFVPILWVGGITLFLLYVVVICLAAWVHPAWWLALTILMPLSIAATGVVIVLWHLSSRLLPRHISWGERRQLHVFIDKILSIAEVRSTPLPVLIFLVAKDILRGKKSQYLADTVSRTLSLRSDFQAICRLFTKN
ncbi:MAG: hypothetical protein WAQ25_00435 [Candidatus Saccharimonas sp.]